MTECVHQDFLCWRESETVLYVDCFQVSCVVHNVCVIGQIL